MYTSQEKMYFCVRSYVHVFSRLPLPSLALDPFLFLSLSFSLCLHLPHSHDHPSQSSVYGWRHTVKIGGIFPQQIQTLLSCMETPDEGMWPIEFYKRVCRWNAVTRAEVTLWLWVNLVYRFCVVRRIWTPPFFDSCTAAFGPLRCIATVIDVLEDKEGPARPTDARRYDPLVVTSTGLFFSLSLFKECYLAVVNKLVHLIN